MISEEWSSDCRRDVPMAARLAEAGGLELRIFTRDGAAVGRGSRANTAESPNADLVNAFLNYKDGRTFQSIPVIAFFTRELDYLCHYIEFPRSFLRDSVHATMQASRPGESRDEVWDRFLREWGALQQSPFWWMWAGAGVDDMLSALHLELARRGSRP